MELSQIRWEPLQMENYPIAQERLMEDAVSGPRFLRVLEKWPHSLTAFYVQDVLIALAQIEHFIPQAYLAVYVYPNFCRQSVGSFVAAYAENQLREFGAPTVRTSVRKNEGAAWAFAQSLHYSPYYTSACMQCTESPFLLDALPVRQYADEDYFTCQALYAKAFHEMRVRVGSFPDSVIARPSEKERDQWRKDAANRFVYLNNGEIVAFAHMDGNELSSVAVDVRFQGQGIGRRFVQYLCNEIYRRGFDTISLWCVIGNDARKLYDSLGFKEMFISQYMRKIL